MTVPKSRWQMALRSVARVERRSSVLKSGRRRNDWTIYDRTGVRDSVNMMALPAIIGPKGAVTDEIRSPAEAEVVKIGKFDVDREVRLRAFYLQAGLSVRFQTGGPRSGVERTARAFKHVRRYAPGLMPTVFDDGRVGRARYLVEESLYGAHPRSGRPLQEIAGTIATELSRLHHGYGISEQRSSIVLGGKFQQRWIQAVALQKIPEHVDRKVRALVAQDRLLEVSFGHGDLVGTNIMKLDSRVVLIDWEYAGKIPIGFDVAKIHLHCADHVTAIEILQRGLGRPARSERYHYSLVEQIALAHARYIAWSVKAIERAQTAGREEQLRRLIGKRVQSIEQILDGA